MSYLLNLGESGGRLSMREALNGVALTDEESQLLNSEQVHLWVPIFGRDRVVGYISLGPKLGGDIFSSEDMDILRVLSLQIGPIIENNHLLAQLRLDAELLERRVEERTAELHASKERVEAILASVGDGVIVTDLGSQIITINQAFETQTGYGMRHLQGGSLMELFRGVNEPGILQDLHDRFDQQQDWTGELNFRRFDGKVSNFQLTISPILSQEKQAMGYVVVQRDITRQRELDRLKGQFISDVSHELRTPVTNLMLYLELMEVASIEKQREYLRILKNQCGLLSNMVGDVLDLSRLEMSRTKKIEFLPVDLNEIVHQVYTAHCPLAENAGLSLKFTPDPFLPSMVAEPLQLARMITNLVANAIRYTPSGEVCILTGRENNHITLRVRDTGMGIDAEDIPHLFERFYRGRRVRQTMIHGTGLGLAIVKEIVDFHSGAINLTSEVGKGTEFYVKLPIIPS
jgi:two-component system phosphate regulon sensor histidine kinase PhoR